MLPEILQRLLGGASNQLSGAGQMPPNAMAAPFQAASMFAPSDPNSAPRMPPQMPVASQGAPMNAFQPQQAPQGAPMPEGAPAPSGGGFADFLGSMLMPQRAAKNQTIRYLTQQGLDEGTATLLAGNKQALQQFLLDRSRGADPMDALKMEKTQLEIEQMRNPTTDDIREYQFAKREGYQGSLTDFMQDMRKASAQNITVGGGKYGTIPPGYELVEGPEGTQMRPIPGSPAAAEVEAAQRAEGARGDSRITKSDVITTAAARARELARPATTGTIGRVAANLSESDAAELRRQVNVLTSNATIENLNAMRQQSTTGGALGNVTEGEGRMLAAAAGAIDPDAHVDDFNRALGNYERTLLRIVHGPAEGDRIFSEGRDAKTINGKSVRDMTDAELEAIINGQ